ncbi:MAG: winged helix-turn-helix domain-containing protein [Trebonia sp.]
MLDFSEVNKRGDRHLYEQIAAVIAQAVTDGTLRPRDRIPSEQEIMDATGASRAAVRHAVAHLRDEGTVYTVKHLGSFVSPPAGLPDASSRKQASRHSR